VKTTPNITIHYSLELAEIRGDFGVEKIVFRDGSMLNVQGVFVAVGSTPNTELADPLGVSKDAEGYICVNAQQKTNISHIYAAGDVTTNSDKFKQTIMSAAE
jgi:thioredoxin reductase (NADPH)